MRAYRKSQLDNVSAKIGCMMDYALNDCGMDGDLFLRMFITSGLASRFETGNLRAVTGMSGIDLAAEAIKLATGKLPVAVPADPDIQTREYWAGWALAHYQWHTARTFASILRYLPYSEITALYYSLRDSEICEFYKTADSIIARQCPCTNLQRIRAAASLSQAELAHRSGVPLQSIEAFEQRDKDINKAQAATLAKIARALGCAMEDLMES